MVNAAHYIALRHRQYFDYLGDGQSRMMANINPGTSDIRTYDRLFKQA